MNNKLNIPEHIAVIMDGNGRWAKAQGKPRTDGHIAGEEALMRFVRAGRKFGVKEMSFYTFSTENWNRSPAEVKFLMNLSKEIMRNRAAEFIELGVQVRWIGRKSRLWKSVLNELEIITKKTSGCSDMVVNFCINYGGRAEIVDAVNQITQDVLNKKLTAGKVTEKQFAARLYSPNMREVDLLIRTSGEIRTSNFLPWQLVYSEMIFLYEPWPEVSESTLQKCLEEFTNRNRRFGKA